jgi:cell division protein FtsL
MSVQAGGRILGREWRFMSGIAADPGQRAARFHRDSDRRRLRAMAAALCSAALLVSLLLGLVGLRLHQVRLAYRLDTLRVARAEVEETTRELRVELATLRALARVELKARTELGMVPSGRDQVRLAREFVPGTGGLAAGSPRIAQTDRPAPPREGAR